MSMNQLTEQQAQEKLVQTPRGQEVVHRRLLQRIIIVSGLGVAIGTLLLLLNPAERYSLLVSLLFNREFIILGIVFSLVSMSLLWSGGQRVDEWFFLALNLRGYHSTWMDRLMWVATQIGNMGFAAVLAVVSFLFINRQFAIVLILGVLTCWLIVETLKAITDRSRPFNLLRETRVIGWREPGLSFPSGHTTQTFFIMSLLINQFHLPVGIAALLYLVAMLVGFTRVYVGAHYPRDVLAGAVLGLAWGVLGTIIVPFF